MIKTLLIAILANTLLAVTCQTPWDSTAETVAERITYHEKFLNETKTYGTKIQVVFFGDSITMQWTYKDLGLDVWNKYYGATVDTGVHAVNYGIGGDKTENLIWRVNQGEFTGLKLKAVVLLIGINNFAIYPKDEDIAKGIKEVIRVLHVAEPSAKVLLLGIFPRTGTGSQGRAKNINKMIAEYQDEKTVWFLDMWNAFSSNTTESHIKDELYSDGLHLTKAGYQVWAENMDPLFKKLLAMA